MRNVRYLGGIPLFHILLGLGVSGFSAAVHQRLPGFTLEYLPIVVAVGVLTAQSALLGFWAAFSEAGPGSRVAGLIVGACWLEALLWRAGERHESFLGLVAIAAGVSFVALWYVRLRKARLVQVASPSKWALAQREGLRFSIGGLMLFTMAVGLVVGGARSMRGVFGGRGPELAVVAIWAICFAACGLASAWAALGQRSPFGRCMAVLLMSAILGALFGYGMGTDPNDWVIYSYFVIVMFLDALLAFLTLLVLRSAGYRLAPRDDATKTVIEDAEAIGAALG